MQRRNSAFTLIEVIIASSMGLVILLSATTVATTMVRAARVAADGQALTTRAQIARGLLLPALAGIGDAWRVDDDIPTAFATPSRTGAMGEGHCAPSTNLCGAGATLFPLTIVDGGVGGADSLRALVPRAGSLESVEIKTAGGAVIAAGCTTVPTSFDVIGPTTQAWAAGDLVLVSNRDHMSVARLTAAFPASALSTPRVLSIDLGPAADLAKDDGGRTVPACSARASLESARVMPISVIDLRLVGGNLEIAESRTAAAALSPAFVQALERIDDLQFRLELARFPKDGVAGPAQMCVCNDASILDAPTTFATRCDCPATERLNVDDNVAPAYRIVGVQIGVLVRGEASRDRAATPQAGMFNRSNIVATDSFVRHRSTFYVGLPNAHSL